MFEGIWQQASENLETAAHLAHTGLQAEYIKVCQDLHNNNTDLVTIWSQSYWNSYWNSDKQQGAKDIQVTETHGFTNTG